MLDRPLPETPPQLPVIIVARQDEDIDCQIAAALFLGN